MTAVSGGPWLQQRNLEEGQLSQWYLEGCGHDSNTWRSVIGRNGLSDLYWSGDLVLDFSSSLSITNTLLQYQRVHKCMWTSGHSWLQFRGIRIFTEESYSSASLVRSVQVLENRFLIVEPQIHEEQCDSILVLDHQTSSIPSQGSWRDHGSLLNQCGLQTQRRHLTMSLGVSCVGSRIMRYQVRCYGQHGH